MPPDLEPDCIITYLAVFTYDYEGCIVTYDLYYQSSVCPGPGSGSGSGSGYGNGSGSSGSGGQYPPGGGSNSDPTPNLNLISSYLSNLTQTQKEAIEAKLVEMKQHCLGTTLYNYLVNHNKTFNFSVDPNYGGQAKYYPENNNLVIRDPLTLDFRAIQEELFHGYQNFTLSGGTAQYTNAPGGANIEFEAKFMRDVMQYIEGIGGGAAVLDPNYLTWIDSFTDGGTKYPKIFSSSIQSYYYDYLTEFLLDNPGYSNYEIDPNMDPDSFIGLSSASNCP